MPTQRAERGGEPYNHRRARPEGPARLSRLHRPREMPLEARQRELRRRFGREQRFVLENVGSHAVLSEFAISNPATKRVYRVAIRGAAPGDNFCSCPDFATNTLGTCKHVEFTLARIERTRGGKAALRRGPRPPYSEVYLHYGARREVRFRAAAECPDALTRLASRYFDRAGVLRPAAFRRVERFIARARRLGHELRCYEDALGFIAQVRDAERRHDNLAAAFPRGTASPVEPLAQLLHRGVALLEQLAAAARAPSDGSVGGLRITRDQWNGKAQLTIPMPDPDTLDRALRAVAAVLEGLAAAPAR